MPSGVCWEATKLGIVIRDLPVNERPREKLLQYGPETLSNRELLAIILRVGTRHQSALAMADHLLAYFGSLRELREARCEELQAVDGIGLAKAAQILAALELGRRVQASVRAPDVVRSPQDAANLMMEQLRYLDREVMRLIILDTKHQVIASPTISVGTLNASMVHPREVFKECIRRSAATVIVVHNHPSGDPSPSTEDIEVTKRLCRAGKILGIDVLDHIIIGDNRFVSMKEEGFFT
ncbi:MAG: DNA repair protein RadC [Firmicutes bacterium]|nr:DNA repair protein RadC [Bacillota bacterium]